MMEDELRKPGAPTAIPAGFWGLGACEASSTAAMRSPAMSARCWRTSQAWVNGDDLCLVPPSQPVLLFFLVC